MSSQMASLLDQARGLWAKGALQGEVGGAFASSATQHRGQETTLFTIITNQARASDAEGGRPS
jgi:NAD(P)H dehydrogenase (quinone)